MPSATSGSFTTCRNHPPSLSTQSLPNEYGRTFYTSVQRYNYQVWRLEKLPLALYTRLYCRYFPVMAVFEASSSAHMPRFRTPLQANPRLPAPSAEGRPSRCSCSTLHTMKIRYVGLLAITQGLRRITRMQEHGSAATEVKRRGFRGARARAGGLNARSRAQDPGARYARFNYLDMPLEGSRRETLCANGVARFTQDRRMWRRKSEACSSWLLAAATQPHSILDGQAKTSLTTPCIGGCKFVNRIHTSINGMCSYITHQNVL